MLLAELVLWPKGCAWVEGQLLKARHRGIVQIDSQFTPVPLEGDSSLEQDANLAEAAR